MSIVRRYLWLVAALALVVAGVVMAVTAPSRPADFGWFAYTPLEGNADWAMEWDDGDGATSAVVLTQQVLVGYGVITLGLLVLVAGLAYRLGRRGVRDA